MIGNPFRAGRPVTGEHFTDRRTELEVLEAAMRARQNAVVISPRRYGKTSLLRVAQASSEAEGNLCAYVNLMRADSPAAIASSIAEAVVPLSRGWIASHLDEWRSALATRLPRLRVTLERDGWTAGFEAGGGHTTDWSGTVRDLMRTLAHLTEDRAPASLILDEFQVVAQAAPALAGVFKAVVDEVGGLSLVMSGSRRHLMEELFVHEGAPLLGTGIMISLDLIPDDDMVDFVVRRMAAGGKLCSDDVAAELVQRAHRVPNTVQLLGFFTWQGSGRRVRMADVERGLDTAVDMAGPELARGFERLSSVQRRAVTEIARRGRVEQVYGNGFLRALDVSQSTLQTAMRRLERDELVWSTPSGWQLVDALLEHWVLRAA